MINADNNLTHVQVTWEYDELYSLLLTEDMGLDKDYDGVLNDADIAALTGFDMNWVQGYNGDLVAAMDDTPLALGPPSVPTARFQDGKIITTHLRTVQGAPSVAGMLNFRPYDGTYYTAYEVGLEVDVRGRDGCNVVVDAPDISGALAMTQAELSAYPEDVDMEAAGLGDIGSRFATQVRVTCAAL